MSAAPRTAAVEDDLAIFRRHVAEDLLLLATLHDREPDSELLQQLKSLDFPYCLTFVPDTGPIAGSVSLLNKTLSELPAHPDQDIMDELAADYASIYLNHKISASPEESVWLDEDSLMCQDSMFQVRSWFESEGLGIPDWRIRPDDHLVYQLQFIAHLLKKDDKMETLGQVATFMDEHLLRWLGNFAERVLTRCETAYFAGIAAVTAANGEELRDMLADILQQSRPSREAIELRMKPKPAPQEVPVSFVPGTGPVV